jgi:hypothetical protein
MPKPALLALELDALFRLSVPIPDPEMDFSDVAESLSSDEDYYQQDEYYDAHNTTTDHNQYPYQQDEPEYSDIGED